MDPDTISRIKKKFKEFNLINTSDLRQFIKNKNEKKIYLVAPPHVQYIDKPPLQIPIPASVIPSQPIVVQPLPLQPPIQPISEPTSFQTPVTNTGDMNTYNPSISLPAPNEQQSLAPPVISQTLDGILTPLPLNQSPPFQVSNPIQESNIISITPMIHVNPEQFNTLNLPNTVTLSNQNYTSKYSEIKQTTTDYANPKKKNNKNQPYVPEVVLVRCPSEPLVHIATINNDSILILVCSNYVELQETSKLHQHNSALRLYQLPKGHTFTKAFVQDSFILLCTEQLTKDSGIQTGIVLLALDMQTLIDNNSENSSSGNKNLMKVTFLKNIESSAITKIIWNDSLGLLLFSTESGNLHGFSSNLDRIFYFEDLMGSSILSMEFDADNDLVFYGTNTGKVMTYNLASEESADALQFNGKIINVSFIFSNTGLLIVSENGSSSQAIVLSYPRLEQKYIQQIDSPSYVCVKQDEANEPKALLGILSSNIMSVYLVMPKTASKVFTKPLDSNPSCFIFSANLFHMKLIQAYYSNPAVVKDDQYTKDKCRYLIDYMSDEIEQFL